MARLVLRLPGGAEQVLELADDAEVTIDLQAARSPASKADEPVDLDIDPASLTAEERAELRRRLLARGNPQLYDELTRPDAPAPD